MNHITIALALFVMINSPGFSASHLIADLSGPVLKKARGLSPVQPVCSQLPRFVSYSSNSNEASLSNSTLVNRSMEMESPAKLPLSSEHRKFIDAHNLTADIDEIGYYATLCVPSALNKLFSVESIKLDFFRVFMQTPSITNATLLQQPSFSSWLFHCSDTTSNFLVSLSTNVMSRDKLYSDWEYLCSVYRDRHNQCIKSGITDESATYDKYMCIDLIDENWDRIYRIAESVSSSILYNDYSDKISIRGKKKKIHYKTYMIPAFNVASFPTFDRQYLSSLTELEHWIYFIKHAHILVAKQKDLAYSSLSKAYDLMDMESWTNVEILQYVNELIGEFHDFSISIKSAETGADTLLSLWPLTEETLPISDELLVFDARSALLSEVPMFRTRVLEFSANLKKVIGDATLKKNMKDHLFPLQYSREIACREKLHFALETRSLVVGFNMTRDLRFSLKKGKDYNIELEKYDTFQDFKYLLGIIKRKVGVE